MTDPTFRTSITLEAPIDRAFKVFTEGFDSWWPRGHHIGTAEMAEAIIEQKSGGRWYERGTDGSECEWGRVLAWDPPNHVAMSWHLNGAFQHDPDPAKASRVDVRFFAEADAKTRVELVHSELDRHGDDWPQLHAGISAEGGWNSLLGLFAAAA
jgi:uncharacterized protein YndB with AHSA1/START domain